MLGKKIHESHLGRSLLRTRTMASSSSAIAATTGEYHTKETAATDGGQCSVQKAANPFLKILPVLLKSKIHFAKFHETSSIQLNA